jgi:hypothetical protein
MVPGFEEPLPKTEQCLFLKTSVHQAQVQKIPIGEVTCHTEHNVNWKRIHDGSLNEMEAAPVMIWTDDAA